MKLYLQAGLLIAYLATFALFLDNNSLSPLIAPMPRRWEPRLR